MVINPLRNNDVKGACGVVVITLSRKQNTNHSFYLTAVLTEIHTLVKAR